MIRALLPLLVLLGGCPEAEVVGTFTDLGSFTTDADGVAVVTWEAPKGVVSTEVFCGPYGYDTFATADSVTDVEGNVVYDGEAPSDGGLRVSRMDDMLPVLIPVSPSLEAAAGVWTLDMLVETPDLPTTVTCGMVNRTGEVSAKNKVDIRIVFVGVDGISEALNAKSAEADESLQAALAGLGDLWSSLGLSVGAVSYADFDGDVDVYTNVSGPEEFGNLLRTAEDDAEITFFLVADLDLGDGASILGLSGGPPGVSGHGGTSKSGVVINVANIVASPDQVSLIMAHEGGHFLGLFHPSEEDLSGVDPLEDTPECEDTDADGALTSEECAGSGSENVMWPTAQVGVATSFTENQGWVVARNPIASPE